MSEFKPERFNVALQNPETLQRDSVMVEVSLDGLKILSPDQRRTLRVYGLKNIIRWELSGDALVLFARNNVDVEERQVTLIGGQRTCQLLLDTLTSFSYQLRGCLEEILIDGCRKTELMKGEGGSHGETGRRGNFSKKEITSDDEVDFWVSPDKEGWMYSQGEVIKTWRRRWFVLKSGFLFRFLDNDIHPDSKPRGCVDLSTVTDISEGSGVTKKPNSLKLSTARGYIIYLTDSETDMVEWLSALDNAYAEIVKRVAGVEDEPSHRGSKKERSDMVSVVGYDAFSATAPPANRSDISLNYGDIDGISGVVSTPGRSTQPAVYERPSGYERSYGYERPSLYPNPIVPVIPYNGSIIDQTPHQTPAYPSFQSISAPDYRMQMPHPNPWQVLTTEDGQVYYHNRSTGKTQWERPPELVM